MAVKKKSNSFGSIVDDIMQWEHSQHSHLSLVARCNYIFEVREDNIGRSYSMIVREGKRKVFLWKSKREREY
jgi:hypothetical protein